DLIGVRLRSPPDGRGRERSSGYGRRRGRAPGESSADGIRHWAPGKPPGKRSNGVRRAVETQESGTRRFGERGSSEPDAVERSDVGDHPQVDLELGVLEADRHVATLQDQPVTTGPASVELELDHHASRGQTTAVNPPAHPPEEDDRVELGGPRGAQCPPSSPAPPDL